MRSLFVYGTLRHPPLVDRLLGRVPPGVAAEVAGWRAARLASRPYPGLVPAADGTAPGTVIAVDERELAVLDRFEGPDYERIDVTVTLASGERRDAVCWRLREDRHEIVEADDWDLDHFVAHDAGAFLGGSRPGGRHPGPEGGSAP